MTQFVLQWGRNFIVAETRKRDGAIRVIQGASMGPQLYRCGNPAILGQLFTAMNSLQWGRNFIVAETQSLYFPWPRGDPLQWGRNFIVAETWPDSGGPAPCTWASMGPQLYRCGNASAFRDDERRVPGFNGAATLSLRKHRSTWKHTQRHGMLQWGRNFIVAETLIALVCAVISIVLQWGRNFIVAETFLMSRYAIRPLDASMGPQLYRCGNVPTAIRS